MDWDSDSLTPEKLDRYRQAAESAWGDDTRHENYIGNPNPAAGQCYVTSAWMTQHEGGGVGSLQGHYFWVAPDRSHVVDLTGDQFEGRGPVMFKRADHPMYKGFRMAPDGRDFMKNKRVQVFSQRANSVLHNGLQARDASHRVALDLMGDPYPGEEDSNDQRLFNEGPFPMLHDEPEYAPDSQDHTYKFVWVNGQLRLAPNSDHEELLRHAGADENEDGPTAVGYADVHANHVTWRVASNVGLQGLRDVLLYHSRQIGWRFDGLTGIDGKPMGLGLGPVMSYYWREKDGEAQIAKTPFKQAREIQITGATAYVDELHPGLEEWAGDMGLRLAEYPGGGNMLDHMRVREDLEQYNNGDPNFRPEFLNADAEPSGPFVCQQCGAEPKTFAEYKLHMDGHEPKEDVHEDGHFPGLPLGDEPLGFGTNPKGTAGDAIASVKTAALGDTGDLGSDVTPWQPGTWGKGMVIGNQPYAWQTNRLGVPHHEDIMERYENQTGALSDPYGQIVIHPSGYATHAYGQATPFEREDAGVFHGQGGIRYVPDENRWQQLTDRWERNASVKPFVFELASTHEVHRVPEFETYSNVFGFKATDRYYGAYDRGQFLGYAVVREHWGDPEVLMVQSAIQGQGVGTALLEHISAQYPSWYTHADTPAGERLLRRVGAVNVLKHRWAKGKGTEPKDILEAAVPFVYDIPSDKLHLGYPGTTTHDVPGKISPGGIVEGYYEPGGKVTIQTYSTWPYSIRHLLDLWYHQAPQMEITSLEQLEKDGKSTKLASKEDWFAPSYAVPDHVKQQLGDWAQQQQWPDGSTLSPPERYHVTGLYSPEGYQDQANHDWVASKSGPIYPVQMTHVESFNPMEGKDMYPVVMRVHHPQMEADTEQLMNEAEQRGLPVSRFDGGYKPHITLGYSPQPVDFTPPPGEFPVGPLHELHSAYDAQKTSAAHKGPAVGPYIQGLLQSDVAASTAYKALRDAGGKVYAVGGAPRDALQGRIPNDIDLMVSGLPQPEVEHILNKLPGNATFAGKNYGVFHYHHGGDTVEIALPRSDDYGEGGRRGDANVHVDPDLPVADDLRRRDFTANATAVDLDTGELVDPHGGADDIARGVLRTTHPDSFREDPSRLVRALTMHGRFGLTPDEQTRHEMGANAHLLRGESPDLLNKVFTKSLKSDNPAAAMRLAHETGLLSHLLPEVDDSWDYDQNNSHHRHSLGDHHMQVLDNISRLTTDPDVRFAAMLHDIGKPGSAWQDPDTGESHYYQGPNGEGAYHEKLGAEMAEERLRKGFNLQRSRINRITHLISNHMFAPFTTPKGARRFIKNVGDENADDLLNLREADQTGKGQTPEEVAARTSADSMRGLVNDSRVKGETTGINALAINGNDLMSLGLPQGPQIGQVLQQLQNEVVDDPSLNQRDTLLGLAQSYVNAQPQ